MHNALEIKELSLRPGRKDLLEQKRKEKAAQGVGLTQLSGKVQRTSFLRLEAKSDKVLDWWSSCKCAHEHWHLGLRPRFYIPIYHYAAPYASFIEW